MKKVFSIWSLTLLIVMCLGSSCSKDDDEGNDNNLVGLWKFSSQTAEIENPSDPSAVKEEQARIALQHGIMKNMVITIEFKSNGAYILSILGVITDEGTWVLNKNILSVTDSEETTFFTITIKHGMLTLTENILDDPNEDYRSRGFTKYNVIDTFIK